MVGDADIPRLASEIGNLGLYSRSRPRREILDAVLRRYHVADLSKVDLTINCDDSVAYVQVTQCIDLKTNRACDATTESKKTTVTNLDPAYLLADKRCVPISSGGGQAGSGGGGGQTSTFVPTAVAAIIHAATDECVYWTYQEDNTEISASTWASLVGLGVLGGGIAGAAEHWPTAATTALSTTGAGIALASGLQKTIPTPVQASVSSVIQSGLSYYPLMKAKAIAIDKPSDEEKIAALAGLWDAAGAGCSPGILKGHSWRTKYPQ
jgi:hypothetical protein